MGTDRSGGDGAAPEGGSPRCFAVDGHFRRLVEIERALTELAPLFQDGGRELAAAGADGADAALTRYAKRVGIAGFFAYALAREGLELVRLTAAAVALQRAAPGNAHAQATDTVLRHIEQIGPLLDRTLHEMEPYRELDAARTVERLAARRAASRS